MSNSKKLFFLSLGILISSIFWFSSSLLDRDALEDGKESLPGKIEKNIMAFIPTEYGRLVDVKLMYPDRNHHIAELWFEDDEGTIRIMTVNKGKSADFQPKIDDRIRVIPRN